MKKNYKLTISYDGTRYSGWEHKQDRDTIQGKIENVLSRMCGEEVQVNGAGRTDAGVHAKAMVANGVIDTEKTPDEILEYMNHYLPDDISINEVREASERFHARFKAVGKLYCYTCFDGKTKPVFSRKYVTILDYKPNIEKMQEAAKYLEGTYDFKSFCGNPRMKKSTVREVDCIKIVKKGDFIYFNVHGKGFLQHMVRIIVGTLLEVGQGKRQPEDMPAILEACSRQAAGPTAPPGGLRLEKVEY